MIPVSKRSVTNAWGSALAVISVFGVIGLIAVGTICLNAGPRQFSQVDWTRLTYTMFSFGAAAIVAGMASVFLLSEGARERVK